MKEKISNFLHNYYFPLFDGMDYSTTLSTFINVSGFACVLGLLKYKEGAILYFILSIYLAGDLIMKVACDEDSYPK